jgi:N-terminal half of MaoC dehydratase
VDYGARMRPGDVITSVRRLAGYSEREGRLGLMLFTTTEDTWSNERGEMVKTTRGTIIRY